MSVALVKTALPRFGTGDETSSRTGHETAHAKTGRPRKYATDAERRAAYRARNSVHQFRLKDGDWDWLCEEAAAMDISPNELHHQMFSFAKCNRHWRTEPQFCRPLPNAAAREKKRDRHE